MTPYGTVRALYLALAFALCSCASPTTPRAAKDEAPGVPVVLNTGVSKSELDGILRVREARDRNEHWEVDRHEGYIRIKKTYTDGRTPVPGGAVEFWSQDQTGQWTRSLTA